MLIITKDLLDDVFKGFQTRFAAGQVKVLTRQKPNQLMLEDFAVLIPSSNGSEHQVWLNQVDGMHEWVGDRIIQNLKLDGMIVINRDFESTKGIKRKFIEDDNFGQFGVLFDMMGANLEALWPDLAEEALLANSKWADGNPFFCAGRKLGEKSVITNVVSTALDQTAAEAGIVAMSSYKLHSGENADVMPDKLIVGPSLAGTAKAIVEADRLANGASNTSPARDLEVRVSRKLTGDHAAKWFISGRKAGIPLVAVQQRKRGELVRMDKSDDESVFMSGEYRYGTDARGEGYPTLPFLGYAGGVAAEDIADWDEL